MIAASILAGSAIGSLVTSGYLALELKVSLHFRFSVVGDGAVIPRRFRAEESAFRDGEADSHSTPSLWSVAQGRLSLLKQFGMTAPCRALANESKI